MSKKEPRREPGWGDDLQIHDQLAPGDYPRIPDDGPDMAMRTDDFCSAVCGQHAINLNHPGIQLMRGPLFKTVLQSVLALGLVNANDDGSIVKLMNMETSLITCDGTVLPGSVHVFAEGVRRHSSAGREPAAEIMLQMLFHYNKRAKTENDLKGHQAHDTFREELIRTQWEDANDLNASDVRRMLNELVVVERQG